MAPPRLEESVLRETLDAIAAHGSQAAAADALGLHRGTFHQRVKQARAWAATGAYAAKPFEIDDLPSELPTADELLARRKQQFAKKKDAHEARALVPVRITCDGPVGIAIPGDPHLDDNGTDIALIQEHVEIINTTEALFALGIGDYSNNWIGRLARLYGQQSTSAAEAWVLVEWYVQAVRWLALIAGNHDVWSGDGDPIKWMAKSARVQYEAHGVRLGLTFPNGRVIRVNARHDFTGRSQYDTAFGVAKAARMGWRDHILVAGHTHVSGYHPLRDPSSGLISHAIRVGSYKTFDRYAEEKGLPNQTFAVCPVAIIDPSEPDESNRCVVVLFDPEEASDYLTWKRKKWARKRSA